MRACTITARQPASLDRGDEFAQERPVVLIVDADPALDRHGNGHGGLHRANAVSDELRPGHQAGAESRLLHSVAGTADIQVDLVVAVPGTDRCGITQQAGLGATKLQRDRMLLRLKLEQVTPVAAHDRLRDDHLCVQQRPRRELAQEVTAMTVGPVHHGRNGDAAV